MLKALLNLSVIGISIFTISAGNALNVADSDRLFDNFPYSLDSRQTFSEHYNLISNSDLLIDSNSDNIPDGFNLNDMTSQSLVNGVFTGIPTVQLGRIQQTLNYDSGDTIYYFANVKSDSNLVNLSNNYWTIASHSGSNEFEFLSGIQVMTESVKVISIRTLATTNFTPISVDYMGAINITDLVTRGILPSGLTNSEYKTLLDSKIQSDSPYFNLDIEYDWTSYGEPVLPGWVSFIDMIGLAMDSVSNFFDYLFPDYGSNNFSTTFGESRFLSWVGSMTPPLQWYQWLRLSDIQYEWLFNHMTNEEKLWLGSLVLDEYDLYDSQNYSLLHIAEEGYLGITNYALNTRYTTYERCVVYVSSL